MVALHQPTTRPEIKAIRGVGVGGATMDLLMETGMITAHGRRQVPGTPTLWVTTPRLLAQFGLRSLCDIPGTFLAGAIPAGRVGSRREAAAAGDTGLIGDDQDGADEAADDDAQPHLDQASSGSAVVCRTCGACCVQATAPDRWPLRCVPRRGRRSHPVRDVCAAPCGVPGVPSGK